MPKPTKGKRLGGSSSHEDQIISNLISALIQHEKIETTVTKAKTVKPYAEKVITKAKKGSLHDRRQVLKMIQDKSVVAKLFEEIGPKYEDRDGGYTRITRTRHRQDADIVMMLYRDDYYNPGTDVPGVAEVNIVKNRSGMTGKVELFFSKEFTQFSNYSRQEQQ